MRNKQRMTVSVEVGEMPAKYAGFETPEKATPAEPTVGPPITVRNITPELAQARNLCCTTGVVIDKVGDDLADRLQPGDVITKVDDAAVMTVEQYQGAVKKAIAAKQQFIVLTIERMNPDGNKMTDVVDIPLAK